MSVRIEIPHCWYVDARPSGEYAAVRKDRSAVLTNQGAIATLTGDDGQGNSPLYLRISQHGRLKFAGQSFFASTPTLIWDGGWSVDTRVPVGINPVIFDASDRLVVSNGSVGAQGYRFVDPETGRIWSGDDTTRDPVAGLWEWTHLGGGLKVGQLEDGLGFFDGRQRRLIERVNGRALRAEIDGNFVSLAFYIQQDDPTAVVILTTLTELLALPVYDGPITGLPRFAAFSHPVTVAFFKVPDGTTYPGHAAILTDGEDWRLQADLTKPVFQDRSSVLAHGWAPHAIGGYEAWNGDQTFLKECHAIGKGLARLVDAPGPFLTAALEGMDPALDWPIQEAFPVPGAGELSDAARELEDAIALEARWGGRKGLALRADDMSGAVSKGLVRDELRSSAALMNRSSTWVISAVFPRTRADISPSTDADLMADVTELGAASPGPADLSPVVTPRTPNPEPRTPNPAPHPTPAPVPVPAPMARRQTVTPIALFTRSHKERP